MLKEDAKQVPAPIMYWGEVDPAYRASGASADETIQYYRSVIKARATKLSRPGKATGGPPPHVAFSQAAASSLRRALQILMTAVETQLGRQLPQRVFDAPSKAIPSRFYPPSVASETPAYFLKKPKDPLVAKRTPGVLPYFCDRTPPKQPSLVDRKHWNFVQARESDVLRRRGKHLLAVLEEQQRLEIQREKDLVAASRLEPSLHMKIVADVAKDRYEAADRIMRILDDYGVIAGSTTLDYLQATLAPPPTSTL
ncbi:hypothetical protein SPRG_09599 [Saprolegnia parasitica CBS 223.65]|uniref:Uncharacterized protein n=1 Tax=Saprolegnia parasitica (strain CBS 223.65) TaxID=695850 RepID=A0A067C711_SAPPC|nr:hypothetical protein SPRG_09599 [Saprolegnia parasitica CBS 223.65]KDO24955.1 hypothetical protein SPRG_09599 [Saprolegnia parasitica CBS 223.65]|eukprot:XP_012204414.1 hypothetical protein SPRG_09599 [Saprolegnia parasitica CBS 223.65]